MRAPPIAKLEASIYRSKGLEKSGKAKTGAEHNKYFSFSKAYYCSVPQIHAFYYNNLDISRATQVKDLIMLL